MEGSKGVLSFLQQPFLLEMLSKTMFVLELEYLNHLSIVLYPLQGTWKCNFVLELQNCPTSFIEEPGHAKVTGCCLKYATHHLDIARGKQEL